MEGPAGDSRVQSPIWTGSLEGGREQVEWRSRVVVIYGLAVFTSAFLIFLVQPMVGKRILPWFGGVPAVWTVCLAFYQTTLFLGYAYAHLSTRFLRPSLQLGLHALVVLGALASLPILPEVPGHPIEDTDPTTTVLAILAGSVGLPFLVLASTGPLVQVWLARAHPSVSPYPLYAISNFGSFLALFVYPFWIETNLRNSTEARVWTLGFGLTCLIVLACAIPAVRSAHTLDAALARTDHVDARDASGAADALMWLALSAVAVVVLMGVTNKLCLDVASFPLLWILPLATYLATFIVAFSSERAYRRVPFALLALASLAVTRALSLDDWIAYQILAYCVLLFSICMLLHGELYRSRPSPRLLTRFYLCVSAGGALGGLFVGLVAPRLFDDYLELPVGIVATAFLLLFLCARDPRSALSAQSSRGRLAATAFVVIAAAARLVWVEVAEVPGQIEKQRSFFGVLAVNEGTAQGESQRSLASGTTVHGTQLLDPKRRQIPTSYYGRATGLGLALTSRTPATHWEVGVIGLGVGTIASYGREGDRMRFYEIDPLVVRLAGPGGRFSFLEDSKAEVSVVLGDGRRSLEREQARGEPQAFDLLVLDAFTSDSIPIHLMTREAFETYLRALAPDGLLAVHVSNRHFRLTDLASRMAAEIGAHSLQITTAPIPELHSGFAEWVLIARESDPLSRLRIRIGKRLRALALPPGSVLIRRGSDLTLDDVPPWSDDFNHLVNVVRWH